MAGCPFFPQEIVYNLLVEICRALLQILRSDWLSHRALFVIVHDEHKQDGGRAFLQSLRRGDIIFTANSNYLNFFVWKFLLQKQYTRSRGQL